MQTECRGAFMDLNPKWLIVSTTLGTIATVTQSAEQTFYVERLGTAGLLVLAGGAMLRWFMAALAKKDAENTMLHREYTDKLVEHSHLLSAEMSEWRRNNAENTFAIRELTKEIRDIRR